MNKELILKGIKIYSENGVNFILAPKDGKILMEYINELQRQIEIKDKWCQLIIDLGYDYDGFEKSEHLKKLIDELIKFAHNAQDNNDSAIAYINGEKCLNILGEKVEGNPGDYL